MVIMVNVSETIIKLILKLLKETLRLMYHFIVIYLGTHVSKALTTIYFEDKCINTTQMVSTAKHNFDQTI